MRRLLNSRPVLVALLGAMAVGVWAIAGASPAAAQRAPRVVDTPPIGSWDQTVAADGTLTVSGWAYDPDARGPATVAILTPRGFAVARTGLPRPDVTVAPNTGFRITVDGFAPGQSAACVGVANAGPKGGSVGFGCRWFTMVDTLPVGAVDAIRVERDRIRVQGWGAVPGSAEIVEARLAVGGQLTAVSAAGPRPDLVAAGFVGAAHGYDLISGPLPSGTYPVCVAVGRAGSPDGRMLHCRFVTLSPPFGVIDAVTPSPSTITVSGWNVDRDAPFEALSTRITVDRLDDISDAHIVTMAASGSRPDVAAAFGVGAERGFAHTFTGLLPGSYQVCVSAAEAGTGPVALLGCRTVSVPSVSPVGNIDVVTTPTANSVRVVGWMFDPETTASIPVTVRAGGVSQTVPASLPRPDVAAVHPLAGSAHGFDVTLTGVGTGVHEVCVAATGVAQGAPTELPCGTVVMGGTRVAAVGQLTSSSPVGPIAGSPLALIDRDAGISTRLRDGSVLWLFGDSSEVTADGALRYFVNNTAAWAPAGSPAVTRDGVATGTVPHRFVAPGPSFPACSAAAPSPAMWPLSAVTVPAGPVDRVIAYFQNICLGPHMAVESRGVAVVEWTYDPAAPPIGAAVVGTVTNQRILDTNTYGNAAVLGDDDLLYVYACDGSDGGWLPSAFGRCRVARVDPSAAADLGSYRWWNGSTWVADVGAAALMTMPDGVDGTNNPVATLTVVFDPVHDVYVMAYSSWPGYSDRVAVRVAHAPQGPWTAPASIQLPGCNDTVGGEGRYCYAATAQPAFSAVGGDGIARLGIGWYDQAIAAAPLRGGYRVAAVPFSVVST